jgi:hypothetical protein
MYPFRGVRPWKGPIPEGCAYSIPLHRVLDSRPDNVQLVLNTPPSRVSVLPARTRAAALPVRADGWRSANSKCPQMVRTTHPSCGAEGRPALVNVSAVIMRT